MENTNVLFDRKRLVRLIVPLIVEQVLAVTVGMADMVMVSGAGETAVSGISLVNTICVLLIVIFTSMASGGSVVGAQFLGSGDKKTACHAAEKLVMICGLIAQQEARRMKEENYEVSQSIGKNLFDNINAGGFDYVISECQTCKWQIDMSSNVTCIHPLTLLCMSMNQA